MSDVGVRQNVSPEGWNGSESLCLNGRTQTAPVTDPNAGLAGVAKKKEPDIAVVDDFIDDDIPF